jgi:hypothetical protein
MDETISIRDVDRSAGGQRHQCSEFNDHNKGSKPAVGSELGERLLSDL